MKKIKICIKNEKAYKIFSDYIFYQDMTNKKPIIKKIEILFT